MNVSRNAPCPCGSGKKFKLCCGKVAGKGPARSLAAAEPSSIEFNRLIALFNAGRFAELESQAESLLASFPQSGFTWKLLCASLQMQGKEALGALQKAAEFLPSDAEAQHNLGLALQDLGRFDDAAACYRRALKISPDNPEIHNSLGTALQEIGQHDAAIKCYKRVLQLMPGHAVAYNNLGIVFQELRQLDDAVESFRHALRIDPDSSEARRGLGNALFKLGRFDEAIAQFSSALEIHPDTLDIKRAYLSSWLYDPGTASSALFEKLTTGVASMSAGLHEIARPFGNFRDPRRKLRIGYVSSDFRYHPVGRNIMPLIGCHDRNKFEIYLYGNVLKPDSLTEWFKNAVTVWRSIVGVSDQDAAEMIRRDEIDVLVFLAGRFDDNRPLIAACRAAPVQVSFHDPVTSGLKAMDYLLTDHGLSPRDTKEQFTECLFHLPTFYVHPPSTNMSDVTLLPAHERGYVTFGSFNNPSKVNAEVAALWSRVLHAIPDSRMVIKYQDVFKNKSLRSLFLERFREQGIGENRIELIDTLDSGSQHLARYETIDIALDTFPFTGSTTTFEALWMGVPVVTLLGDHMVARWSGAMLKRLKLDELIAQSEDEYVKIAQALAQDTDRLATLRAGLRERVARSPLCDETRRTRQIERAYRWMWAKWCAVNNPG